MYALNRNGANYSGMQTVAPTGSPMTWQNPEIYPIRVIVSGGTLSTLAFSLDGINFVSLGLLAGTVLLNPGEWMQLTYLTAPTISYTAF